MGKKSSPPPPPPSPSATASAQTSTNIGTAIAQQALNNTNQVTPHGTLTYNKTGVHQYTDPLTGNTYDIPTYTAKQSLSPNQQAINNQTDRAKLNFSQLAADQSSRLSNHLGQPINTSSLPDRGDTSGLQDIKFETPNEIGQVRKTYGTDFSSDRQRVEDALMQRMQGGLDRDREALDSRLASQGIRLGSKAYQSAQEDMGRQVNNARLEAIIAGGQEQSRLAGLEAQRAGFENTAQNQAFGQDMSRTQAELNAELSKLNAQNQQRGQALQEDTALRNQPINEITALMSGSQVTQPNFITPQIAQMPTTDFAGIQAAYNNAMNARHASQVAARGNSQKLGGSIFGGLASIGAAAISDKRLKKDIKKIGKTNDGQPIYQFKYKDGGGIQMGLMAQEVEKKKPEAVVKGPGGIKMVNYQLALSET